MNITSKGQVTIPQKIREKMGLLPHTEVEFILHGEKVYIQKATKNNQTLRRGQRIIERMQGTATIKMSTEEILSLTRA